MRHLFQAISLEYSSGDSYPETKISELGGMMPLLPQPLAHIEMGWVQTELCSLPAVDLE